MCQPCPFMCWGGIAKRTKLPHLRRISKNLIKNDEQFATTLRDAIQRFRTHEQVIAN